MSKKANDALRADYVVKVMEFLKGIGEDAMLVESNAIAIPCVDSEGNDNAVVFTVKIPTGSRDGEGYDPYEMAKDYEMKCKDRAEKAKAKAEAKAKKIAYDKRMREKRAKERAEKESK